MIKFNPEGKDTLTYGEALGPIFKITNPGEAQQYKRDYVIYLKRKLEEKGDFTDPEQVANSNIGYYAGYGSNEDCIRIEKLFTCQHPVFGTAI